MTSIQKAAASDVPALLPLVAAYWSFENISGFEPERVAIQLNRLLSQPRLGSGWIATMDGSAVGYLLAVYVFSLEHLGLTAEVDELFVAPSWQAQGIGAQLLKVAESEFVQMGCTNVSFQLARNNDAARIFYRRHAYEERAGYDILDKMLQNGLK